MENFELVLEDTDEELLEAKRVWAKRGNKVKRMIRCTSGKRKGRVVAKAAGCTTAINIKKRFLMKKIRRLYKQKMARKAKKTKRFNPASRRLKTLNRAINRK